MSGPTALRGRRSRRFLSVASGGSCGVISLRRAMLYEYRRIICIATGECDDDHYEVIHYE